MHYYLGMLIAGIFFSFPVLGMENSPDTPHPLALINTSNKRIKRAHRETPVFPFPQTAFNPEIKDVLRSLMAHEKSGIEAALSSITDFDLVQAWIDREDRWSWKERTTSTLIVDRDNYLTGVVLFSNLQRLCTAGVQVFYKIKNFREESKKESMKYLFALFNKNALAQGKCLLVTGSYDWTNEAQTDCHNLHITDDPNEVNRYKKQFRLLKEKSQAATFNIAPRMPFSHLVSLEAARLREQTEAPVPNERETVSATALIQQLNPSNSPTPSMGIRHHEIVLNGESHTPLILIEPEVSQQIDIEELTDNRMPQSPVAPPISPFEPSMPDAASTEPVKNPEKRSKFSNRKTKRLTKSRPSEKRRAELKKQIIALDYNF